MCSGDAVHNSCILSCFVLLLYICLDCFYFCVSHIVIRPVVWIWRMHRHIYFNPIALRETKLHTILAFLSAIELMKEYIAIMIYFHVNLWMNNLMTRAQLFKTSLA